MRNFILVKIDANYCDYLRKYDSKVVYNAGLKDLRPFIGVLFNVNDIEFFAPLSSPKPKHILLKNTLDLIKINYGKYGVINLNNMIPVKKENYRIIDLNVKTNNIDELKRLSLLKAQLRWLNNNSKSVRGKATRLYNLYINNQLPINVRNRCCNFIELQDKSNQYTPD